MPGHRRIYITAAFCMWALLVYELIHKISSDLRRNLSMPQERNTAHFQPNGWRYLLCQSCCPQGACQEQNIDFGSRILSTAELCPLDNDILQFCLTSSYVSLSSSTSRRHPAAIKSHAKRITSSGRSPSWELSQFWIKPGQDMVDAWLA